MEQETQHPPDSGVWDDRATEVIAQARKMPLGERRRAQRSKPSAHCRRDEPVAGNQVKRRSGLIVRTCGLLSLGDVKERCAEIIAESPPVA
jgi:hypothetical protein